MNTFVAQRATLAHIEEVLGLFDAVQVWLVARGLKDQWGDLPFSKSEAQRERFAAWLDAGSLVMVQHGGRVVGTLVFSLTPPDYAKNALMGRAEGGYLEAFAVHRDYAGRGVGAALLAWAEGEAVKRGLKHLRLDCWAENQVLRAYYRRAGFSKISALTWGAWNGILHEKTPKALP